MTYHTFGLELLPHEARFLVDSNVVRRVPDRMIPPGNRQYDMLKDLDRTPLDFWIGEFDLDADRDDDGNPIDPFGFDSVHNTRTYRWRHMFEQHFADGRPGFDTYHGHPAAHKRIDYVRVWDVPDGMKISAFPN